MDIYLLMNISVLGVLPWQTLAREDAGARQYTIAVFAQTAFANHAWAHIAGGVAVVLIALAALASVYALLLGYSRIPYAAARDGNFPSASTSFRRIPPVGPRKSILRCSLAFFCASLLSR